MLLLVCPPAIRFSSTVRSSKTRRPSITWKMPIRTISSGYLLVDPLPQETDLTVRHLSVFGFEQAGNGLQGGGFAGAVVAEDRHDLALLNLKGQPFEHQDDVVIDHFDVVDHQ